MPPHISQVSDNARLARQHKRDQVEQLLRLVEFLTLEDRVLIEQVFEKGMPVSHVAKLFRRPPRQLQRHTTSIIKRMSGNMFRFVALHMNTLPPETRPVARHVVLHGRSLRDTAAATGTSLHSVRKHMTTVRATARLLG